MPIVLVSIIVSLLPARYRGYFFGDENLDVRRGAILSSILQFVACGAAMWALYPAFVRQQYAELAAAVAAGGHQGDKVIEGFSSFAYGPVVILAYIFRPVTLVLLYFMVEGMVRIFAIVASNQVLPTLPLQLVAWTHDLVKGRYQEYELGPRVADVVQPGVEGKYDLKIQSCRPKDWNPMVTICYQDKMYEMQSEETGLPPRQFVYLLRLRPGYKVVRGLHDYDPEEPLRKPGWAEVPEKAHQ